jgi:hypothetical protein
MDSKFFYGINAKGRLVDKNKGVLYAEKKDKGLDIKNAVGKIRLDVFGWKTEREDESRFKYEKRIIFPVRNKVTIGKVRIERGEKPKIKGALIVPRKLYKKQIKKLKAKNLPNTSTVAVYFAPLKNATQYRVYRKKVGVKGGYKKIEELKGLYNTGFEDFCVTAGKKYKYKVRAYKGKKKLGKASKVVTVVKR